MESLPVQQGSHGKQEHRPKYSQETDNRRDKPRLHHPPCTRQIRILPYDISWGWGQPGKELHRMRIENRLDDHLRGRDGFHGHEGQSRRGVGLPTRSMDRFIDSPQLLFVAINRVDIAVTQVEWAIPDTQCRPFPGANAVSITLREKMGPFMVII